MTEPSTTDNTATTVTLATSSIQSPEASSRAPAPALAPAETPDAPAMTTIHTSVGRAVVPTKRGAGYTEKEDDAVAKAWVKESENAITGSDQKGDTFYQVITDFYNSTNKPSQCEKRVMAQLR